VWFRTTAARLWPPETLAAGERQEAPAVLVERLACFALVDNARGQSLPFHRSEVEGSKLQTEITSVDDGRIALRISGSTRARAKGPWLFGDNDWKPEQEWPRSLSTEFLGAAAFDFRKGAFVEFRLVALGRRQGRTTYNGRGEDPGPAPIGLVLELAPPSWRVPPTFLNVYNADWVKKPR
ncbi:MAG: hypothetical protein ACE5F1_10360, partial [Planctomycetota bacterium]